MEVAFDLIHDHSYGSVSVDQICSRARVNKGSFYYYYKSKTALVVAAYEERWRLKEPDYERVFALDAAPLERLSRWCEYVRSTQRERFRRYGHVCGCPYASVGGELATQDKKIQRTTQNLVERHVRYLAKAIEDARDGGDACVADPLKTAELVHSYVIGLLLRAKIYNDLKVLADLETGVFALVKVNPEKNPRH